MKPKLPDDSLFLSPPGAPWKRAVGLLFPVLAVLLPLSASPAEEKQTQAELPVVEVSLYSSGVGYFRHAGDIEGPVTVSLPFKEEEINDVLKSLVLETPDNEPTGFVVFPSQQPLDRLLKGFLVDLSGHPSLAEILIQLRGTPIRTVHQGKEIQGRILGMEQRPVGLTGKENEATIDWFLNLATHDGVKAIAVRDLEEIRLIRGETLGDLSKALDAMEQAGGHERKNLQLSFPGSGKRRVEVGYIVETSLWKSGYRLQLSVASAPSSQASLQGWAIVENQTDNDWSDIRLSLVSGRPISFIQELYSPRYANRPRVHPREDDELAPVRHESGISFSSVQEKTVNRMANAAPAPEALGATAQPPREAVLASNTDETGTFSGKETLLASLSDVRENVSVRFEVEKVNLPRRRGAMIPFFSHSIPMERISLFNARHHATRPFRGLLLENVSPRHLPAGPVTLFEGERYAGDALLDDLSPGQKGLLTYALDHEIQVLVAPRSTSGRLTSGRIAKGILKLTRRNLSRHEYLFKNNARESRVLLIEHPRTHRWNLVKPDHPCEMTSDFYRFRMELAPLAEMKIPVVEEMIRTQEIHLVNNLSSVIFSYASEEGFSEPLKQTLEHASRLQGDVEELDRKLDDLTRELRADGEEQNRIRNNLGAIPSGTAFHNRMMSKMDAMESAMEEKVGAVNRLKMARDLARKRLETYLSTVEL
ncbi:MAG: hypothetical protein HQL76_02600 [Magnetococcales bacterium]|nr:hypothetical protein [Magnetococcales bacterium]